MTRTFNCVLIGDHNVGKTAFITRHLTGEFIKKYESTNYSEVWPLKFNTSDGEIVFNVCINNVPHDIDCAIMMFDLTDRSTFNYCISQYNKFFKTLSDIPVILLGNKCDLAPYKVTPDHITITFSSCENVTYGDISVKSKYNINNPFLCLSRLLLNNPQLQLFPF